MPGKLVELPLFFGQDRGEKQILNFSFLLHFSMISGNLSIFEPSLLFLFFNFFFRYMVDSNIFGCNLTCSNPQSWTAIQGCNASTVATGRNWIELPAGTWRQRPHSDWKITTSCQIEVDVPWKSLISHAPEGD